MFGILFASANKGAIFRSRNPAMLQPIAEFDDSLDPRFAALFFYNFFD